MYVKVMVTTSQVLLLVFVHAQGYRRQVLTKAGALSSGSTPCHATSSAAQSRRLSVYYHYSAATVPSKLTARDTVHGPRQTRCAPAGVSDISQ